MASVQLARMGVEVDFFTALGDDERGRAAVRKIEERGVRVHAAWREAPQRRAFTFLDSEAERTITVAGERHVPHGEDCLPWEVLGDAVSVYFTGGDQGSARGVPPRGCLGGHSPGARPGGGPARRTRAQRQRPRGALRGGRHRSSAGPRGLHPRRTRRALGVGGEGRTGTWAAAELPGPPVDSYGCGDTFAAALALALGRGDGLEAALAFAAGAAAACLTGRGPYGAPLPAA